MDFLEQIRAVVGDGGLITGEDVAARPADWLGRSCVEAKAIVRPRSTQEVSEVMKLCYAAKQTIVPAGGLTGLVHGQLSRPEDIQVSFERMRAIESIDPVGRTITVQSGVPLQAVHEAVAEHGLIYGVDLGARGSCTIGGNISTNAGGNSVLRYGMTRDNVLGLEAVLADGTIISSMNTLLKNNTAYDLKQLFIGSEGTLGLVTRAVLRLHPAPASEATAIVALDSFEQLKNFFALAGARLGSLLRSFEAMWDSYYNLIGIQSGRHQPPLPTGHAMYVVIEIAGTDPQRDDALFTEMLGDALKQGILADAVIALSKAQRDAIWAIREDVEGQIHMMTPGVTFDVSLPIKKMQDYIDGLKATLRETCGKEALMVVFGHIGDNNLHINVSPRPWNEHAKHAAEAMVYRPLAAFGGSISAEHGIGIDKREWLPLSRNPAELTMMRQIKATLDPLNLINPGKVLG
ncbi:FAD-binding oxidoreductase [Sphingosinicella soli]|uniref:FAD/FMN-containing dehydrogenase n=1 Tax=Sphingosinicella soli TaxID=333708 RepID=A0A7W7F845_9SPHN|nr:FAD-binding oxidoreductase [Sphingosinicella soli]MBB4633349.1 FAD/FMN-containing dehydrogenase [Sphingosinicella soli]